MTTETEIITVVDPYTDKFIQEKLSPKSLRKLLRKVKQNNPLATDRLCSLYVPIVCDIYTDSLVQYILGEDAVNIVWEIFLSFVKNYRGNNFKHFPGLVRKQLLDRIKNQLRKPGNYKYYVSPASDTLEAVLKDDKDLNTINEDAGFYAYLKGCSKKQIKIATLIYKYDLEKNYVADILHMNRCQIQKINTKILAIARKNYLKQDEHTVK